MNKFFPALLISICPMVNASTYHGIYSGGFTGPLDNGIFATMVFQDSTAIIMAYDYVNDFGFDNVLYVNTDGSFEKFNIDWEGTDASGSFSLNNLSGTYSNIYGGGTFNGNVKSKEGLHQNYDGYYFGDYSGTCYSQNTNGYIHAILAADGSVFFYSSDVNDNTDGGILNLSNNILSGSTLDGGIINGNLNNGIVNGSFSYGPSCSGSFNISLYQEVILDSDLDLIENSIDNCPNVSNFDQTDTDQDGYGDACDEYPNDAGNDQDGDGISGHIDNCPAIANKDQLDTDNDGEGDVCDADDDNDGVQDINDAFPLDRNESIDSDMDGVGDNTDNCQKIENTNQLDTDLDGIGNACDEDDDGDGYSDLEEESAGTDPLDNTQYPRNSSILKILPLILDQ